MDVSITKIYLETSILMKSIMGRREYISLLLKRKAVSGVTLLVSDFALTQNTKLPTNAINLSGMSCLSPQLISPLAPTDVFIGN
jgi:hypothetical protein